MITFPKAKINLGLRVTDKRADGFHDIETVFYPVGLTDALEFIISSDSVKTDELVVTGINIGLLHDKNLVIQAVKKLRETFPVPFLKIHLHKAIPSGAGLGGGSSDAAYILKGINKCLNLSVSDSQLKSIALELGSDCPFFINPVPSLATGRGEILKPVGAVLEGYYIILLNPGISISTRDAYLNSHISQSENNLQLMVNQPVTEWKKVISNDFEDYAFKLYPQISDLKKALYKLGAVYSSMSGSGSTVYGIFSEKPEITGKLKNFMIFEGKL
ncbi:MAG: 4-(cytidine 5'-diphospho)-2-C-methyl-D-erythritol kinase [Bacteroidales bacterium]|jgi:4-diphosphocytidyl-2-C-methyl-D-erythritol kinase|nr:4-(cytidine 5'-diphospho)-2-C-methyl-D-erythritol kinase [Bacteroidales bacterium]